MKSKIQKEILPNRELFLNFIVDKQQDIDARIVILYVALEMDAIALLVWNLI